MRRYSDFYNLALEIKKWHTRVFRVCLQEQNDKIEEEFKEFYEHPCMEEYADCFIAITAAAFRFDSLQAKAVWNGMVRNMLAMKNCDKFYKGIVHKFEVDKIRKFVKKNGIYRHIEEKK